MIAAIKSLAFDILRALDEATSPEALEHSIEVAHKSIETYRAANEPERVADILRDSLSIDAIEQKKATENKRFVFFAVAEAIAIPRRTSGQRRGA